MSHKFYSPMRAIFVAATLISSQALSFEVDSFHRRTTNIKDSTAVLNTEINKRIDIAIQSTKSCNYKELYTNVRNQMKAGSTAFGVIGGLENWSEKNNSIDRIDAPKAEDSIYYGTHFESVFSMGFWLNMWGTAKTALKKSFTKATWAVKKLLARTSDPVKLCQVPDDLAEIAKKTLERQSRGGPGGPGGGGPPPPGDAGGPPPPGPPPEGSKGGPPGPRLSAEEQKQSERLRESGILACMMEVAGVETPKSAGNLQSIIKVNGEHIGSDKLGHFFSEGQDQFDVQYELTEKGVKEIPGTLKKGLQVGTDQEEGMFGLGSNGIKSYGDLAANHDGSKFWAQLGGTENPYVKCVNGKFIQVRQFDFKDYVTPAWDEGINCSEYKDQEMADRVAANLKASKMSCPAEVDKCKSLKDKYSLEVMEAIVSPACKTILGVKIKTAIKTKTDSKEAPSERGVK